MSKAKPTLTVLAIDANGERTFKVVGQYARALDALIIAGNAGTTALEISTWALRLSHYIHILRRDYGLSISMELEPHSTGQHGRYFLNSSVKVIERGLSGCKTEVAA